MRSEVGKTLLRIIGTALVIAFLPLWASTPEEAARLLAQRVRAAVPTPGAISLTTKNGNVMPELPSVFAKELGAAGLTLVSPSESAVSVVLTISEGIGEWVLVAQTQLPGGEKYAIQSFTPRASANTSPDIQLAATPVLDQSIRMLDFLLVADREVLVVLEPHRLVRLTRSNGAWAPEREWRLTLARPLPRDPRGRLLLSPMRLQVLLPGTSCSIDSDLAAGTALACTGIDVPFPVDPQRPASGTASWVAGRNTLRLDGSEVFSAASLGPNNSRIAAPTAEEASPLGDDLAAVTSGCGASPQIVASSRSDLSSPDRLQSYELAAQRLKPSGKPLQLAGPVTALWPHDVQHASVVIFNPQTQRYEANLVSIACGR